MSTGSMKEFSVRVIAPEDLTDVEFKRALDAIRCRFVAQPMKRNRPAPKPAASSMQSRTVVAE